MARYQALTNYELHTSSEVYTRSGTFAPILLIRAIVSLREGLAS